MCRVEFLSRMLIRRSVGQVNLLIRIMAHCRQYGAREVPIHLPHLSQIAHIMFVLFFLTDTLNPIVDSAFPPDDVGVRMRW